LFKELGRGHKRPYIHGHYDAIGDVREMGFWHEWMSQGVGAVEMTE